MTFHHQQHCLSSLASESARRNHRCAVISRLYETEAGKRLSLGSPWDPAHVRAGSKRLSWCQEKAVLILPFVACWLAASDRYG